MDELGGSSLPSLAEFICTKEQPSLKVSKALKCIMNLVWDYVHVQLRIRLKIYQIVCLEVEW